MHKMHRITPFGNPGVNGYVLLTPAYRSLSRPSSPDSSQASAIDLYSLGHIIFSALFLNRAVRVYPSLTKHRVPALALSVYSLMRLKISRINFRPSFVISKIVSDTLFGIPEKEITDKCVLYTKY